MKILAVGLLALLGGYAYMLMHTLDIVTAQTQHLQATYQYVEQNADHIATGN